jgi:hypothetical protein
MHKSRAAALAVALLASVATAALTTASPAAAAATTDPLDGSAVAVKSMAAGRIDLFTRGPDNALHQKTFVNGAWTGWIDLGGNLSSAPTAVSWTSGRLDVFARSSTNTLIQRYFANGVWSNWFDLGGGLTSAPSATSWGQGRLDVFVRGANNVVYQKWYAPASGWSGFVSMGGEVNSAPTGVSYQANHVQIFARGVGGQLFTKTWNSGWSEWTGLGGTPASAASVISSGAGKLDVYTQAAGNTLQHRTYQNGAWGSWVSLGSGISSAPAAVIKNSGQIDVFSVSAAGDLQQKAYAGSWPANWTRVSGFAQSLPVRPGARTVAFQGAGSGTAVDPITYAYVDNIGRLRTGQQSDPDNFGTVQWSVLSGNDAFTGEPSIAEQLNSRVQVAGHNVDGDVWTWTQTAADNPAWGPVADAGGWVAAAPTIGRLSDGRLVLFGADSDGKLWARLQATANGAYGDWKNLSAAGAASTPVIATSRNGLQLFATTSAGELRTAEYTTTGTLSAWTSLGAGYTGPSAVVYPGFRTRVFARAADGTIQSKLQNADLTWPATWDAVGTFTSAGAPSAILDPVLSRTAVVARGADNEVYRVFETAQGSGTWGDWSPLNADVSDPAATDPTVAPITNGSGQSWIVVYRNANDATRVYTRQTPGAALRTKADVTFARHTVPAPPAAD